MQIPNTLCFYENWMINYSVSGDSNSSLVSGTMSYNSLAARIHSLSFSIVYGLLMNQNYTLTIIFTDSGESSITASANFGKFKPCIMLT